MRFRSLLGGVVATAALVAVPVVLAGGGGSDIRSASFGFTATNLMPPIGGFGEPSIALSSKDHVFFCGPDGLLQGNAFIRSADWKNFERFEITDTPVNGEDCDVKVGPDDAVYEANLQVAGSAIRKSVLDGQGPPAPPNTTGNGSFDYQVWEDPVEQDRQWLAPDPTDGSIVYYGYHDLSAELEFVAKSLDGGKTFAFRTPTSTDPTQLGDTVPNTFSGPLRVDPVDHNTVVQAYGVSTAQDNIDACNTDTACFGYPKRVLVAVSTDGGLTYTDHVAMDVSGWPGNPILGNIFPWVTFDRAGNVYVMAGLGGTDSAGNHVNGMYYAVSKDKGLNWSQMHKINAGSGAVVFPTMAGGSNGIVDFGWLESTAVDQADPNGYWRVRFAQSRNATGSTPTFTEVRGPVVRHGGVCTLGIVCTGDRDLADFMEIALDSFGYAHIASPATDAN